MAKKMAKKKTVSYDDIASSVTFHACKYIPVSALPISEAGHEDISNSSNVTFGDANRTMFTIERLLERVSFDDENDIKILEAIAKLHGPLTYIDLEN